MSVPWAYATRGDFLREQIPNFKAACEKGVTDYWLESLFNHYFEKFPPIATELQACEAEMGKAKKQITKYYRNTYSRPLVPSPETKSTLRSQIKQICLRHYTNCKKHIPQAKNAFSTMTGLKDTIAAKYKALYIVNKANSQKTESYMNYQRKRLDELYKCATPEQLQEVDNYIKKCAQEMKKLDDNEEFLFSNKSDLLEEERDNLIQLWKLQQVINHAEIILDIVGEVLQEHAGLCVFAMASGPEPCQMGQYCNIVVTHGITLHGLAFNNFHPTFETQVVKPFCAFSHNHYTSKSVQKFPSIPYIDIGLGDVSDNAIDLTMPELPAFLSETVDPALNDPANISATSSSLSTSKVQFNLSRIKDVHLVAMKWEDNNLIYHNGPVSAPHTPPMQSERAQTIDLDMPPSTKNNPIDLTQLSPVSASQSHTEIPNVKVPAASLRATREIALVEGDTQPTHSVTIESSFAHTSLPCGSAHTQLVTIRDPSSAVPLHLHTHPHLDSDSVLNKIPLPLQQSCQLPSMDLFLSPFLPSLPMPDDIDSFTLPASLLPLSHCNALPIAATYNQHNSMLTSTSMDLELPRTAEMDNGNSGNDEAVPLLSECAIAAMLAWSRDITAYLNTEFASEKELLTHWAHFKTLYGGTLASSLLLSVKSHPKQVIHWLRKQCSMNEHPAVSNVVQYSKSWKEWYATNQVFHQFPDGLTWPLNCNIADTSDWACV